MAGQSYNFTFQNQNPTSGWTGASLAETAASLYNNPFDPVDPGQAIQDTTEADPEGTGDIAITSVTQGQALLKRTASLLKNLEKQAKKAADLDTMKYLNEQIVTVQKEQMRIQGELTKLGVAGTMNKKGEKVTGATANDTQWAAAAQQAELTKKITKDHAKIDKQTDALNAHTSSIEALKSAIASTTDAKVLADLQKQLGKEQQKFSKEQTKLQSQTAHLTELQTRLTAINTPVTTTPPVTTGTTGTTGTTAPVAGVTINPKTGKAWTAAEIAAAAGPVAGVTINPKTGVAWTAAEIALAAAHPGQSNYFDELVDKTLASRSGVSGWHSDGGALPAAVAPVTTTTAPPVVTTTTPPVVTTTAPPVTQRALTPQELAWRAKFDPRGWANSAGILTPTATAPVIPAPVIPSGAPTLFGLPPMPGTVGTASGWT